MSGFTTALNILRPSLVAESIRSLRGTGISFYVHGSTGISKSSVAQQVADSENIAFIDLRLSQLAPEDIRGVPMPTEINSMKGIVWIPPLLFPRDLNYSGVSHVDASGIHIERFFNPLGNNHIRYCTDPKVSVRSVSPNRSVEVIEQDDESFTVQVKDSSGNMVSGTVVWKVTGRSQAILALEEFNSATPSVMAAAYQLILDRRIGDYVVPEGVMILAMGNRDTDRGVTYQIPKPVANRFVHVTMEFHWEDWVKWAEANEVHSDVIGFLSKWPTKVNTFDPKSPHLAFATPRSWERVSKLVSNPVQPCKAALDALICGAIGDAVGLEFIQHRRFMSDMPAVADILSGSVIQFRPVDSRHEIQISYSVAVEICYELKKRAEAVRRSYTGTTREFNKFPARIVWLEQADRALGYIITNFRLDVAIAAVKMATVTADLPVSNSLMPKLAAFLREQYSLLRA